MARLKGTAASDHLTGGSSPDIIDGSGGDDWLEGVGGGDKLTGKAGDDSLYGGVGNDQLFGGNGYDWLSGGAGNDLLDGGTAPDPTGPDWWGEFDTVSYFNEGGTQGVTVNLATGKATDTYGDTDTLKDIERVAGTLFDDTLKGGNPANDDHEVFIGFGGADTISGGSGDDTAEYYYDRDEGGDQGIVVNLATGVIRDGFGDKDKVSGIEYVRGTSLSDSFIGSQRADTFMPSGSSDTIDGGGGSDTVAYGLDLWRGGRSGIVADLRDGWVVDCSSSLDTLTSIENVKGSFWDDIISGTQGANELLGDSGNDGMNGRNGNDTLLGSHGDDRLYGGAGNDYLEGWTGTDRLRGGAGQDRFGIYEGSETDIILDFQTGTDKLDLRSFHFASANDVLKLLKIAGDGIAILQLNDETFVEFQNVNTHGTVLAAGDLII